MKIWISDSFKKKRIGTTSLLHQFLLRKWLKTWVKTSEGKTIYKLYPNVLPNQRGVTFFVQNLIERIQYSLLVSISEAKLEPSWTSKMELIAKIVNCSVFTISTILDVRLGTKYTCAGLNECIVKLFLLLQKQLTA